MSAQPLFSPIFLKQRLQTYSLENIDGFAQKKKNIDQWITGLKSGALKKKETTLDADFMNTFFGDVLGYEIQISKGSWNLEKKYSVPGGKEADGALGYFVSPQEDLFGTAKGKGVPIVIGIKNADVRTVIELKSLGTDLDKRQFRADRLTPVEQAFGYANKLGENCKWLIVSNYNEIRLYNKSIGEERYESFFIPQLSDEYNLRRFFYLLSFQRLFLQHQKSQVDLDLEQRQLHLQNITKNFYAHYKKVRLELFDDLRKENKRQAPIFLLEKAQKILDRILFICFCEWLAIIPNGLLEKVFNNARESFGTKEGKLWNELKGLFENMDKGLSPYINKFNGGLFKEDKELNKLIVNDWVLEKVLALRTYDYSNDLTVNILGHIFEQSISDYEEISSKFKSRFDLSGGQIASTEALAQKDNQRKKEGIFYTPEYITTYIVNEAVGGWLEDRKKELGFYELPVLTDDEKDTLKFTKQNTISSTAKNSKTIIDSVKKHSAFWLSYREELRNIKVLDPACGSGAFLVKVFDVLKKEGETVNKAIAELKPGQNTEIFDLDKHILTDNIFGVDINRASVEITQLSLWLKTADRSKELTTLDSNIQCGNSLIDDENIAGEFAFDWRKRFPQIFKKIIVKEKSFAAKEEITVSKSVSDEEFPQPHLKRNAPDTGKDIDQFHDPVVLYNEKKNGFDVIVGNPPYVVIKGGRFLAGYQYRKEEINYIKEKYTTGEQQINTYVLFIELAANLINKNGYASLIVPNTFLANEYSKKLREFLLSDSINVVSLNNSGMVFENVNVESVILTFAKTKNKKTQTRVIDKEIETNINLKEISELTTDKKFRLTVSHEYLPIIKKIKIHSPLFNYANIWRGLTTGNDNKFLSEKKFNANWKKIVTGKEIDRYFLHENKMHVNYNRELLDRARDEKIFLSKEKLISKFVGERLTFCYDDGQHYVLNSGCVTEMIDPSINIKYLLAILNSNLVNFYFKLIFSDNRDTFPIMKSGDIEDLPVVKISSKAQKPFILLSETMLSKNNELQKLKKKFLDLLISDFKLEELSNRLKNWIGLNWNEVEKELKKINLTVRGKDKEEWFERFTRFKKEAEAIQSVIKQTDDEIDKMVYELYELTEPEIKIVEGS